jgi:hypothetical protein
MGGLLEGVKLKIWSICNQIASGRPVPHLRVGLVAFRDRGDDYVTKITPLSSDLDKVHEELLALNASGGGDEPESVNEALAVAVNKIEWSTDKRTMKLLFLVGDAPPHMDYDDDVKYPITCKKAVEKRIIINAVQCGDSRACQRYWKDIASKAGGSYVAIPQKGGVVEVETSYDDDLARLGADLLKTALIYGNAKEKRRGEKRLAASLALRGPVAADRAAFAAKSKRISAYDLLDDLEARYVKLESIEEDHLPKALRALKTIQERKRFLDKVARKREELQKEVLDLERKRVKEREAELARRGGDKDSFDRKVLEVLRSQSKKYDIEY